MILPVLFLSLCSTVTESLLEDEPCSLTNGSPGTCVSLGKCQSVYDELLAGSSRPDTICGYEVEQVQPIICCPKNQPTTTTLVPYDNILRLQSDGRGEISRRKCVEYSMYAWNGENPSLEEKERVNNTQMCAQVKVTTLISSQTANMTEFPHMAAIGYNNSETGGIDWSCGGTLISETFVLTAAHCIYLVGSGYAELVRVGDLNLKQSDDGATPDDHRIVERIRHPEYKPPSQYHDIALLRLENRVPFDGWIRPACLHTETSTGTERAVATGWDRVKLSNESSADLLKTKLSLVDPQICRERWSQDPVDRSLHIGVNPNWMICTDSPASDIWQGESGGPLVIFSNETYNCMYDVIGVMSLGKPGAGDLLSIYTRVYQYVPWIESIVWPEG